MSAPGVIPTVNGSLNAISIRGSASVEIGYQFDGIDFSGNFFDENGDDSYLNGVGGGHGAMQESRTRYSILPLLNCRAR